MRVNTAKSMQLARRVKGHFGTWQAVRQAARVEDGVYVLEPRDSADHEPEEPSRAAWG